jgi:PrtD family type I secretion system ABC transporter
VADTPTQLSDRLSCCKQGWITVGVFSMAINVLLLTVSVYMLQVYDRVLPGRSVETLIFLTLMGGVALAAMGGFEALRSRILVRIGVWLDQALSPALFERGLDSSLRGLPYCTESLRDLATLRAYLSGAGIMMLFDAPWMPIYLLVIFLLHPFLGVLSLGGAAALFSLALINNQLTTQALKQSNLASTKNYQAAESAFRNVDVIDSMGMSAALVQRWEAANCEALTLQARASDTAGLINACIKSLRLFLQMAVLGLGAWLVLRQELSGGSMIAASIIMSRALAPVEQAVAGWNQTTAAYQAWTRLSALFQLPPIRPPNIPLPRPRGHLMIEEVIYAPPGVRNPVLRGISFSLAPGEAMAILGPSAAGKSTLARLIVGLAQPQHGLIRLDGADVFAWDRSDLGRYVGYLGQDVALFSGTVRENIARMGDNDSREVIGAAMLAGVHEMILRLPNGYETQVGEGGALLSGGQRQRVGLARALFGFPALLVLDEPNSNLDVSGEAALNRAVAAMKERGSTVVVVAHRPALLAHMDQVLVLNGGQMQIAGPREAVMAQLSRPRHVDARVPIRVARG